MGQEQVSAANAQLVKDLFAGFAAQLAPILSDVALTPAKLKEALKPYVDPAALARDLRERKLIHEQALAVIEGDKRRWEACPHKDKNERTALCLVHNHPDRQPRAICPLCRVWIEPAHWEIPGPQFDGGNGMGEPYIVPAHPLYHLVRGLESMG
jgi:hypothetical protein